jgi:hypothetical protein
VRLWRANFVLKEFARQKRKKIWPKRGLLWGLIEIWQSEWSVVSLFVSPNTSRHFDRGFGHVDTWIQRHDYIPCHTVLYVKDVFNKNYLQWFRSPHTRLILVRVTFSSSWSSNSTPKFVILEPRTTSKMSWQTSWGHVHMKTSSIATVSGNNLSGRVWLHKGVTLKRIMIIISLVFNKNVIAPDLLLYRHNLYRQR